MSARVIVSTQDRAADYPAASRAGFLSAAAADLIFFISPNCPSGHDNMNSYVHVLCSGRMCVKKKTGLRDIVYNIIIHADIIIISRLSYGLYFAP